MIIVMEENLLGEPGCIPRKRMAMVIFGKISGKCFVKYFQYQVVHSRSLLTNVSQLTLPARAKLFQPSQKRLLLLDMLVNGRIFLGMMRTLHPVYTSLIMGNPRILLILMVP